MPEPRLEVRFSLNSVMEQEYYHSFLVYADENGRECYFSAGSRPTTGSHKELAQAVAAAFAAEIVPVELPAQLEIQVMWDNKHSSERPLDAFAKNCEREVLATGALARSASQTMMKAAEDLNESKLTYHTTDRNCHVVTATLVKAADLQMKVPESLDVKSRALTGIEKPLELSRSQKASVALSDEAGKKEPYEQGVRERTSKHVSAHERSSGQTRGNALEGGIQGPTQSKGR